MEATLGVSQGVDSEGHNVPGVQWNPGDDRLIFDVSVMTKLASTLEPTKRNVVSIIGRSYDPLGYLATVHHSVQVLLPEIV